MSNTQINPYRLTPLAPIDWQPIAAGLLADDFYMWDFDGDLLSSRGGGLSTFASLGGAPTYQAGINGQEMRPGGSTYVAEITGGGVPVDHTLACVYHAVGTSNLNRVHVGWFDEIPGASPRHFIAASALGTKLGVYIDDNLDADYGTAETTISPNTRHFVRYNFTYAGKVADWYVDEEFEGTTAPVVGAVWGDYNILKVKGSGADNVAGVDFIAKLMYLRGRHMTDQEAAMVYNGGNVLSYADIVALAAP